MVIDGLGYSFGVLLEPIQREFKVTGPAFRIDMGDAIESFIHMDDPVLQSFFFRQVLVLRHLSAQSWQESFCSLVP